MKKLRVIFMGTPDFAVGAIKAIRDAGHEIVCVYTQPPRPKGRGKQLQASPAQVFAEENNIPVRTPTNFKGENDVDAFKALNADIAVVAAYGMLLPQVILDAPKHGCINIHPSRLPRWRGTSPVQYAIWAGDETTDVSVMKLVKKMDAGPVVAARELTVPPRVMFEELNAAVWKIGAELTVEVLDDLAKNGVLKAREQGEEGVTYTTMLKKEDGFIDWSQSAVEIDRQIRALTPWPGVSALAGEERMKILAAEPTEGSTRDAPGTILNREGHVACGGNSILKLLKVQPAGGKAMDFCAALNGGYLKTGQVLR